MFRAGGAGVTQEVTSREKLESVNKMGREGIGEGCRHKARGSKEECSGSTRVVCDQESGQEQAEPGGQRLVQTKTRMPRWAPQASGGHPRRPVREGDPDPDLSQRTSEEEGPQRRPDTRPRTKLGLTVAVQVRDAQGVSKGRRAVRVSRDAGQLRRSSRWD